MTALKQIAGAQRPAMARRQAQQLTHQSSTRENVFEHILLGQLGAELLARGIDYDELHSSVDKNGFDVVLEAGNILRHTQVKVTIRGGARSDVTVGTRLAARPSGCVVWLTYDPASRSFCDIRWFGAEPGEPLPDLGERVARHSRANSRGLKAHRPDHRVVPVRRFERLADIGQLADRLFGSLPHDPLELLQSHLRQADSAGPPWLADVGPGDFAAIPAVIGWDEGAALAQLVDGYRLLELLGGGDPMVFLDRQRAAQRETGRWPGDAAQLWTTLFLEVRADHFGANDHGEMHPQLDLLCRQLRHALTQLETSDA